MRILVLMSSWGFHLDILQELRNSGRIVMSVVVIWGISKHILEQYKQRRVPYRRHRHCLHSGDFVSPPCFVSLNEGHYPLAKIPSSVLTILKQRDPVMMRLELTINLSFYVNNVSCFVVLC